MEYGIWNIMLFFRWRILIMRIWFGACLLFEIMCHILFAVFQFCSLDTSKTCLKRFVRVSNGYVSDAGTRPLIGVSELHRKIKTLEIKFFHLHSFIFTYPTSLRIIRANHLPHVSLFIFLFHFRNIPVSSPILLTSPSSSTA